MNLSGFKKLAEDKKMVTMGHPSGHEIKISKSALSALQRKQIERLPIHLADGGDAPSAQVAVNDFVDKDQGASLPVDSAPTQADPAAAAAAFYAAQKDPVQAAQDAKTAQATSDFYASNPKAGPTSIADPNASLPKADPNLPGAGTPVGDQSAAAPASIPSHVGGNPVNLNKAYAQGQQAIQQNKDVSSQLAAHDAQIEQENINAKQALEANAQQNLKDFSQHRDDFANYLKSNPINPNHYQESLGTGQKVATAIGLILGGFQGGFNRTGVNPAADFLNKQIDRDIESQKAKGDQQKTIFAANQALYGDQVLATNATRANLNDVYSQKIRQAADQLGTPAAQAAANDELSKLAFSSNEALKENSSYAAVGNAIKNGGAGLDPLTLARAKYIPQEQAIKEQQSIDTQKASISNLKNLYGQSLIEANPGEIASPASKTRLATINAGIGDAILRGDINHRVSPETRDAFLAPYQITTRDYLQGTIGTKLRAALDKTKDLAAGTTPYSAKYIPAALPDYSLPSDKAAGHKVGDIVIAANGTKHQIINAAGDVRRVQ